MTITQELVKNVLNTEFTNFDSQTLDYAKIRIIETVGAMIGGIHSSGVDMMLDLVNEWGGRQESTILGIGKKVPAANAVLVMGIAARSNDFEPGGGPEINGKRSPGHYSATTVPTALAMAEKLGLGGRELMTALILGDDLASRIGVAGAGPWDLGWDPAGTCSRFGAATVSGKLMRLNENQILNALGIVLNQIAGTMQSVLDYTHCYKISQGLAGWNGIMSAELARRGFTGPKEPLMSRFGYYRQYCREVDTSIITKDLGKRFFSDEEFKLYPCCRGNAGSVESAIKLVQAHDINPEDIAEINIDLDPMWKNSFLVQSFKIGDSIQASGILNLSYNVANILLRKNMKLEHYSEEAIRNPRILELTQKIKINPNVLGKRMSSLVKVKMKNGHEFSAFTEVPRGDLKETPLTKKEIIQKFETSTAFSRVINAQKTHYALNLMENLEDLKDIAVLVKTLTPD